MNSFDWLARLVAFDTTSRNSNLELIADIEAWLKRHHIPSRLTHDSTGQKANLFATLPAANGDISGGIILSGHTDVVPIDGQKWHTNPFKAELIEDKIYGRGTCDMKGFIAVVLSLIPELQQSALKQPVHFAFSYDEEVGCLGARLLIADLQQIGVKPKACIVGEPTDMHPIVAHKGIQVFRCRVHGAAAHSSLTHRGCNAIEYAAKIINYLRDLADLMRLAGPFDQHFDVPFIASRLTDFKQNMRWRNIYNSETEGIATIPMRVVGPVTIKSFEVTGEIPIPLATLESPLWPSTHRGARVCTQADGIRATIIDERMTRSILVEADTVAEIYQTYLDIQAQKETLQQVISESSRFAKLIDMHAQIVGSLLYLRFELLTGDAAGHNMVTLASDRMLEWILSRYPHLRYVSISGNFCSDKKVSAVNGILGRGKNVVAEVTITKDLCKRFLKTEPEKIVELNIKKNLLGNIVAGGLRTANAHFANMLLGFYLATGQDAANIIEGSQGIVHAEIRGEDLYFSVTLPNLIIGAVGSGKTLAFVQENLQLLGCMQPREPGYNARRLAIIAASAVLCGELSLLAAQTNQGELMRSHLKLERKSKIKELPRG